MPVAELLARTSSAELAEWMAYEHVTGPLGPERGDLLHGILTATIANTASKQRRRPADFIPKWDRVKARLSPDELLAKVKAINRGMGGTDTTRR